MTDSDELRTVRGRARVRPTPVGWAVLAGMGLLLYRGLTDQPVILGSALSLLIILLLDAVVGWRRMAATDIAAAPLRKVGTSKSQPSVLFTHEPGPGQPLVRLSPLIEVDPLTPFVPVALPKKGSTTTLEYGGSHPIAKSSIEFEIAHSWLGLVSVKRLGQRQLADLILRGPDYGDRKLTLPFLAAADDISQIREYVPGDRFSRVNWPATARTTTLHVREEAPLLDEVVVVLLLTSKSEISAQHRTAKLTACLSLTRNVLEEVLDQGRPLRLISTELHGVHRQMAMVAARAMDKNQPRPDTNLRSVVVDRTVTDTTGLLTRLALAEPTELVPQVREPHVLITLDGIGTSQ